MCHLLCRAGTPDAVIGEPKREDEGDMGMDLTKKRTSNEDSSNSPLSTNDSVVGMDGPGPGQPTTPSDQGTRRELFAYQQHAQGHTTDLKRFRQQSPPNNNRYYLVLK